MSDPGGNIFDHPSLKLSGRSGDQFVVPHSSELIPLPLGSQIFSLPGRIPVGWKEREDTFTLAEKVKMDGKEVELTAVAAFLPPGFIRTLLPATRRRSEAPTLPLWAYSAVGWKAGRFWVPGLLIDSNPHWNPRYFQNDRLLRRKVNIFWKRTQEIASLDSWPGVLWNITASQERMFFTGDGNARCLPRLHAMPIVWAASLSNLLTVAWPLTKGLISRPPWRRWSMCLASFTEGRGCDH